MEIRKSVTADYEDVPLHHLVNDDNSSVWFTSVVFPYGGAYLHYGGTMIASVARASVDEFKALWEAYNELS